MEPHVFTIEGMTFVSGLFWYPLAGLTQSDRMQEIRSLAHEQDFNLYILRQTSTFYVGFAHSGDRINATVSSAAAVVSKTLELESQAREFIFVSPLPDGRWIYVAQRDGVILPDGDKSFPNEDAAKSKLLEDISLGDWSLVFAPDIWGIPGSLERDFASFIPETSGRRRGHKWWKLHPVSPYGGVRNLGKVAVFIGIAGVLGLAGLWYYQNSHPAEPPVPDIGLVPPPPPPPPHPWKEKPLAKDVVAQCLDSVSKAPLFPGNWKMTALLCRPGSLDISWEAQEYGWINHIRTVIPNISISGEGKIATLSIPLSPLTIGKDESVTVGKDRTLDMYAKAQKYGFTVVLTSAPPAPPPLPGQANAAPAAPPPDWSEISWKVEGTGAPAMVADVLDANGFRLNSMSAVWEEGALVWTMEGTQYVLPQ